MTENCQNLPRLAEGATLPEAAAAWAAAGWRVHPCSPETKRPFLAADIDPETKKKIKSSGGVSKASADANLVAGWWKKWRHALIGVAMGDDRVFVVDFDPRHDDDTGEEWTLDRLKADTEAMMGCALPLSVTSRTPSGGTHLWLRWPDDGGDPIRNSGSLPKHVDVRGEGGYVIVPPGTMGQKADNPGGRYRWLKDRAPHEIAIAEAPAELVALLRTKPQTEKKAAESDRSRAQRSPGPPRPPQAQSEAQYEAQRKYALSALDLICRDIRQPGGAGNFGRNDTLNAGAYAAAALVAAGVLDEGMARAAIEAAAKANPGRDDPVQLEATLNSGWDKGYANPKDLSAIGARATGRAPRPDWGDNQPRSREEGHGLPRRSADRSPDRARGGGGRSISNLPSGRVAEVPTAGERVALARRGGGWLRGRLAGLAAYDGSDDARAAGERLAYSIGRKLAADMITPLVASLGLWAIAARVTAGDDAMRWDADEARWIAPVDPLGAAVWDAAAKGWNRPDEPGAWLADLRCAIYPMTDLGNAERFVARFSDDFRFTTAKGWMGWDGRRWRLFDQEKDTTPAEVMAAVFAMVRSIQDEARILRESGRREEGGMDRVVVNAAGKFSMLSVELEAHGRKSEGAGRMGCIANLAKRWLTVSIGDFDTDPFAINCLNGTIRIERRDDGAVRAVRHDHDRADLISKLAPVIYDPEAPRPPSPLFTGMIEWAQPDASTRRYVRQWMGYSASGHVGAQILHFWYGLGGNGKSAVIDVCHAAIGDYGDSIGIETFLDQGVKKRGDQATPDLADLGGVRGLRASEPGRGAKIDAALIKMVTGGEPMKVRALHKGFFPLRPQFKLTISGNHKLDIPDTDEGIWRRVKMVPWDQQIEPDKKDEDLVNKIKGLFPGVDGELDGVFAWLIDGLLDWRANGFVESEAVREATADYREDSDPLARFLNLCVEMTSNDSDRVQSSVLHAVFCAWARAAGETEWKQKGFTQAMKAKGMAPKSSNGMQFKGMRLLRHVEDFVDEHGNVLKLDGAMPLGGAVRQPFAPPDDGYDDGFGPPGGGRPSWMDRD